MAIIVKTPSGTWKAVIRKAGWPTTIKTFRLKKDADDCANRFLISRHQLISELLSPRAHLVRHRHGHSDTVGLPLVDADCLKCYGEFRLLAAEFANTPEDAVPAGCRRTGRAHERHLHHRARDRCANWRQAD